MKLKELATEYSKVKEENQRLQADLNKSKRLNKNLRKENRRLFRRQNAKAVQEAQAAAEAAKKEPRDPLEAHVTQQLQQLLSEKAKLVQENCQLTRDNQSLQELLRYAVGEQDESGGSEGDTRSDEDSDYLESDSVSTSVYETEDHQDYPSDLIHNPLLNNREEFKNMDKSAGVGLESIRSEQNAMTGNDPVSDASVLPLTSYE